MIVGNKVNCYNIVVYSTSIRSERMNDAASYTTFVYPSNIEHISFNQAWKAAGFSSLSTDYYAMENAVLVEMK